MQGSGRAVQIAASIAAIESYRIVRLRAPADKCVRGYTVENYFGYQSSSRTSMPVPCNAF